MNQLHYFNNIDTFIFDVDGVFTDNSVLVMENGDLLRKMSVHDGYALKHALKKGYRVCIITGGNSEGVNLRFKGLGVTDIYSGVSDKLPVLKEYISTHDLETDKILYMGDDIPDRNAMSIVSLPCCPKDAVKEILEISQYISPFKGGEGCVRDVIEKVLRLQGKWIEL